MYLRYGDMKPIKTKSEAKAIFGSNNAMAEALGVTPGALSQWSEILNTSQIDRVAGALLRTGLLPPDKKRRRKAS